MGLRREPKIISIITPNTCKINNKINNMSMKVSGESPETESKIFSKIKREDVIALKNGLASLEFDVEVIDTEKVTYNGVLYPKEPMERMQQHPIIVRQLANGGIDCEANHPKDREKDMKRWEWVDENNISHYITKFFWAGERNQKLMARIRTSLSNTIIVDKILAGIMPAFSIRGLMSTHPDTIDGRTVQVCDEYIFISLDYVHVNSNEESSVLHSYDSIKVVSLLDKGVDEDTRAASGEAAKLFGIPEENLMLAVSGESPIGYAKVEYVDTRDMNDIFQEVHDTLFM